MSEKSMDLNLPTPDDLEKRKRQILNEVIESNIPQLAKEDIELAKQLARQTLEDIRLSNNQDLEKRFWEVIKECGIDL